VLSRRRAAWLNWAAENDLEISAMINMGKLFRDVRGVGTIEYALVAMLISVAALSAYANLGSKVQSRWSNTYRAIS